MGSRPVWGPVNMGSRVRPVWDHVQYGVTLIWGHVQYGVTSSMESHPVWSHIQYGVTSSMGSLKYGATSSMGSLKYGATSSMGSLKYGVTSSMGSRSVWGHWSMEPHPVWGHVQYGVMCTMGSRPATFILLKSNVGPFACMATLAFSPYISRCRSVFRSNPFYWV